MPTHYQIARMYADFVVYGTGRSSYNGRSSRITYTGWDYYSYNTVVMRCVEHRGRKALLVSDNKYSSSTSKHIRYGSSAVDAKAMPIFRVPSIGRAGGWNHDVQDFGNEASFEVHRRNVTSMHEELVERIAKAKRQWLQELKPVYYGWGWRERIAGVCTEAKRYIAFFEVPHFDLSPTETRSLMQVFEPTQYAEAISSHQKRLIDNYQDPKNIEKRARARARRMLRETMLD